MHAGKESVGFGFGAYWIYPAVTFSRRKTPHPLAPGAGFAALEF